jgi:type II secretory pathway component PulF
VSTEPAEPFATESQPSQASPPAPGARWDSEPDLESDLAGFEGSPRSEPLRLLHLMYVVAFCALMFWLAITGGPLPVVGVLFLISVAAISTGFVLVQGWAIRQDSLLGLLAIASEKGIPLAPAIVAYADQYGSNASHGIASSAPEFVPWRLVTFLYRGRSRRRMMRLAADLNSGLPLPEALERSRGLVSRDAVLLSWVGDATGLAPRALRMAATARSAKLPIWAAIASRLTYIVVLLLVLQTICGFILYFIVPKFEAIFSDFGLPLPHITVLTIRASHTLGVPLLGLLSLAGLAFLVFVPFSFISWGNYDIPLFDRLLGRRHSALVMRCLGLYVEAGKPIALGVSMLAQHYPTFWIRHRLGNAKTSIQHGADWIEALWQQQLIRAADANVLRASVAARNLAWALAELAESGERRLAIRFQILIRTVFPVLVLAIGVVFLWMAVSFFSPLVTLIMHVASRT